MGVEIKREVISVSQYSMTPKVLALQKGSTGKQSGALNESSPFQWLRFCLKLRISILSSQLVSLVAGEPVA